MESDRVGGWQGTGCRLQVAGYRLQVAGCSTVQVPCLRWPLGRLLFLRSAGPLTASLEPSGGGLRNATAPLALPPASSRGAEADRGDDAEPRAATRRAGGRVATSLEPCWRSGSAWRGLGRARAARLGGRANPDVVAHTERLWLSCRLGRRWRRRACRRASTAWRLQRTCSPA